MIALEGMSLSLYNPLYSKQETNFSLIDDISIELRVESCLYPKHKEFPTIRVNIEIDRKIEIELNLSMMKKFFYITDMTGIQLECHELMLVKKNKSKIRNKESDGVLL